MINATVIYGFANWDRFEKNNPPPGGGGYSGPSYSLIRTKPKPYHRKFVNL